MVFKVPAVKISSLPIPSKPYESNTALFSLFRRKTGHRTWIRASHASYSNISLAYEVFGSYLFMPRAKIEFSIRPIEVECKAAQ